MLQEKTRHSQFNDLAANGVLSEITKAIERLLTVAERASSCAHLAVSTLSTPSTALSKTRN